MGNLVFCKQKQDRSNHTSNVRHNTQYMESSANPNNHIQNTNMSNKETAEIRNKRVIDYLESLSPSEQNDPTTAKVKDLLNGKCSKFKLFR